MNNPDSRLRTRVLTLNDIDEFELVEGQLDRFHGELLGLAKSKANDALNTFKLSLLNNLLTRSNTLLGAQYEAVAGFTRFDAEQLPSTSDALLVVSQYLGALEKLRSDNIGISSGAWHWFVNGGATTRRAAAPARLGKK